MLLLNGYRVSVLEDEKVLEMASGNGLEKAMAPHSSILAWKIPQRTLVGCSPWGRTESDTTETT